MAIGGILEMEKCYRQWLISSDGGKMNDEDTEYIQQLLEQNHELCETLLRLVTAGQQIYAGQQISKKDWDELAEALLQGNKTLLSRK